ncbi:MAG: transposase [Anaerolineae bacterium]
MDPITIAIGAALARGLVQVGGKLLEKGVLDPALEPATKRLKKLIQRPYQGAEKDQALLGAVQAAFHEIGAPQEEDAAARYLLNLGFDQLQAGDNDALRQELARAVLLMTAPDPGLVPDNLWRSLRWPTSRRQVLVDFLVALRRHLDRHNDWGALIKYADREAVRRELRALGVDLARTATAVEQTATYVAELLRQRGLDPAKPDAQALAEYIDHLLETHSHISFLFIKPAGRRSRVRTEAELETVFVPLQVQDPETEERLRRLSQGRGTARRAPTLEQFGQPVKGSLPTVIRSFKSAVAKHINELRGSAGISVWQRNYYEHIVRSERALDAVRQYILNNPARWTLDRYNPAASGPDPLAADPWRLLQQNR